MNKKRVLIVEDDSLQNRFFEKIVSVVQAKSELIKTGKAALDYLKNHDDIGLVLLDLSLPDISGLQVLEELKKQKSKVPVAILSANDERKIIMEAGRLGAIDFFVKGKDDLMRLCEFIDKTMNE